MPYWHILKHCVDEDENILYCVLHILISTCIKAASWNRMV